MNDRNVAEFYNNYKCDFEFTVDIMQDLNLKLPSTGKHIGNLFISVKSFLS